MLANTSRFFVRLKLWRTIAFAPCATQSSCRVAEGKEDCRQGCRSARPSEQMKRRRATKSPHDPGSYRYHVLPEVTSSGIPVIAGASTILPSAIASMSTSGMPSLRLVSTTASARAYKEAI